MKLKPGSSISHYKILSEIGKGGMGEVYLARDTKLERKVALKFLHEEFSKDKASLNRFQREAKAASALNHPGILTIYEVGEADGAPYISSEYIQGTSVGRFAREETVSLEKALDIAIQVVTALKAAHESGIVHRDIKPENVMIRSDGIVKILDFGLAKLTEQRRVKPTAADGETLIVDTSNTPKTIPGMVVGTANYMSPEQARGKKVDQRSDIFSVGALLFEVLTRKKPFEGETTSDVLAEVLKGTPPTVSSVNKEIPEPLSNIVEKCLKKRREERYQSSAELLDELRRLKKHLQIEEVERTILPGEHDAKTKIMPASTVPEGAQTDTAGNQPDTITIQIGSLSRIAGVAVIVILAAIAGIIGWNYFSTPSQEIKSIAVMPFVNESGDEEIEYLADGMTETLISRLTQIPDLSVKARSSVFRFKGTKTAPREIGKQLFVETLLIGRIVQRGDQLTINLELVDGRTETVIWSETYIRQMSNLVTLQTEIARKVSEELETNISGEASQKLQKTYTSSADAYQEYLKGRFHWNKRTEEGLRLSIQHFRSATEHDPNYAHAWSGLADSYVLMPIYSSADLSDSLENGKSAARKAIEIDPTLGEAYNALAFATHRYEWKFAEAEEFHKKAVQLNPKAANAHHWYALMLSALGRHNEAIPKMKTAVELEPFSRIMNRDYTLVLLFADRLDETISQSKKAIELDPDYAPNYADIGMAYEAKKMYKEAAENYIKSFELSNLRESEFVAEVKKKYEDGGWKEFDLFLKDDGFRLQDKEDNKNPVAIAMGYAQRGDRDTAFSYLTKAHDARDPFFPYIRVFPLLKPLRDDPRFETLVKKIGLPE